MKERITKEIETLKNQNRVEENSFQSIQQRVNSMNEQLNNLKILRLQRDAQISKLEELLKETEIVPENGLDKNPKMEVIRKEKKNGNTKDIN